jgi:DNA polymerase
MAKQKLKKASKGQLIEALAEEIRQCKKCELWRTRNKAVAGEGNVNAKIMIIGQAPGKQEDATGRPFVGRAGKFLEAQLKRLGKNREDFFITSVLKCFPPSNRKPTKQELFTCLPYTLAQIAVIKPKALLLLGEIATEALLKRKFREVRGKFVRQNGIKCFATFHPSAAMRFKKVRQKFLADLSLFFKAV